MADPIVFHDNPDPTGEFPDNVAIHSGLNDTHELKVEGPSLVGQPTAITGPAKKVLVDEPLYFDETGDLNIDLSALTEAQAAISVLQGRITTDEAAITALQGQQATNVATIATLQTARLSDEANITALQAQANYLQQQINALIIKFYPTANALFTGAGSLTASMRQISQLQATMAGVGGLTATMGLTTSLVPFLFAGAGNLTAVMINGLAVTANWAGAGGGNASLTSALAANALLAGSGSLNAALSTTFQVGALLAGAGGLTANLIRPIYILPPLMAGAGSLTASLGNLMAISGIVGPNLIPNPTASGGVAGTPGTMPTSWVRSAGAGLTFSMPTVGTDPTTGINYVDNSQVGTSTQSVSRVDFEPFSGAGAIPAGPGQFWIASFGFTVLVDDPNVTAYELQLFGLDNTGTGTLTTTFTLPRTVGSSLTQYQFGNTLVFPANTVAVALRLLILFPVSTPVNYTIRYGGPSLAQANPSGAGSLTANLIKVTGWQALANFNGVGSLSITDALLNTLQAASASMAGVGSANISSLIGTLQVNALMAGSGGIVAAPTQTMQIAGFTGPNMCPNPTTSGAVVGTPGTFPTSWVHAGGGGLTTSVANMGTDPGTNVNYIDVTVVGTTTTVNNAITFGLLTGVGTIPAAPGQSWLASFYWQLLQDDPNVSNHEFLLYALTSTGAIVQSYPLILPRTARPFTQYFVSGVNFPATTVGVVCRSFTNWSLGNTVNFRFRLGAPSLVQTGPQGAGGMTANLTQIGP